MVTEAEILDVARRAADSFHDDRALSYAWEGAARAAHSWDVSRGKNWLGFGYMCARNRVIDMLRREDKPRSTFPSGMLEWFPVEHPDGRHPVDILLELMPRVKGKPLMCAVMRFAFGASTAEIAEEVGTSPSQVRNYLHAARMGVVR